METFASISRGAQAVVKDCQIAHDLWRQGDKRVVDVLDGIAEELARLSKGAIELADAAKAERHAEIPASGAVAMGNWQGGRPFSGQPKGGA